MIRSIISNTKQKRSHYLQQTSQAVVLTHPSVYDYQLRQQHFPPSQPTSNYPLFQSGINSPDLTIENNTKHDHTSKTQENNSQSLLAK
jgi:hypothetical protein